MFRRNILFSALALAAFSQAHAVCYVNATASGANDGKSWDSAYTDLQSAMTDAACSEIWVAKGVYKPGSYGGDSDRSFNVNSGVAVYGGFNGSESNRDDRDWTANITILSGDLDGDDTHAGGSEIDETPADIHGTNSNNVVTMDGTLGKPIAGDTVLDGFTITGGYTSEWSLTPGGAGLYCNGANFGSMCSPTLSNLAFIGNNANRGGGLYNDGEGGISNPVLENVLFRGNGSEDWTVTGGAVFNDGYFGSSNPTFKNVIFRENHSGLNGGAVQSFGYFGSSNPEFQHVLFIANFAAGNGGAIFNDGANGVFDEISFVQNTALGLGGAMLNAGDAGGISAPVLTNVTFAGNIAATGGAMANDASAGADNTPTLTNVTFSANSATMEGGAIANIDGAGSNNMHLTNTILWGDSAPSGGEISNGSGSSNIDHSIVEDGCPKGSTCSNLFSSDPLLGALGYSHGALVMRPSVGSPAIDAGDDISCPAIDQRGFARPQGAHCDIGAVELRLPSDDLNYPSGF